MLNFRFYIKVCDLIFGVPKGLGLLFSLEIIPLSTIIEKHSGIKFRFYAEDTLNTCTLHMNEKDTSVVNSMYSCLQDV